MHKCKKGEERIIKSNLYPTEEKRNKKSKKSKVRPMSTEVEKEQPIPKKNKEELPIPKKNGEEHSTPEKNGEEQPTPKKNGEEQPIPKKNGEEQTIPKKNGEEQTIPKKNGEEQPTPKKNGEEQPTPKKTGEEQAIPKKNGEEQPTPKKNGEEQAIPKKNGEEQPIPKKNGEEQPIPKKNGDEQPTSEKNGDEQPTSEKNGDEQPIPKKYGDEQPIPKKYGDEQPIPKNNEEEQPIPKKNGEEQPIPKKNGEKQPIPKKNGKEQTIPKKNGEEQPTSKKNGEEQPIPKKNGDEQPIPKKNGDEQPIPKNNGEEQPIPKKNGEKQPIPKKNGEKRPIPKKNGEEQPIPKKNGDEQPIPKNNGEEQPIPKKHGEKRPIPKKDGEKRPIPKKNGEEQPIPKNNGEEQPIPKKNGEKQPIPKKKGEEQPIPKTNGEEEPTHKKNGEEQPTPKKNGEQQPTPKKNGEEQPTPKDNGEKQPTPKKKGEEEPIHKKNGEEQPIPKKNGEEQPTPKVNGEEQPIPEKNEVKEVHHCNVNPSSYGLSKNEKEKLIDCYEWTEDNSSNDDKPNQESKFGSDTDTDSYLDSDKHSAYIPSEDEYDEDNAIVIMKYNEFSKNSYKDNASVIMESNEFSENSNKDDASMIMESNEFSENSSKDDASMIMESNEFTEVRPIPTSIDHCPNSELKKKGKATNVEHSTITVTVTSNSKGIRKFDKKQYCLYCGIAQSKLPRHLETRHKNELEIQQLSAMSDKKERQKEICRLQNLGNHRHNSQVLRRGSGTLIVVYRPQKYISPYKYSPCPTCLGYYSKRQLYKHKCLLRTGEKKSRERILAKSRMLLAVPDHITEEANNIFNGMREDRVTLVAKNDKIISELARKLYNQKGGSEPHTKAEIRNTIRETSRLLIQLRTRPQQNSCSLLSCIEPKQFRDVVAAVKIVSGYNGETNEYAHPELARKLGMHVKKCSFIAQSFALEEYDRDLLTKAECFQKLYDLNFTSEVGATAIRNRKCNQRNKPKMIPLTKDVVKLSEHLTKRSKESKDKLRASTTSAHDKQQAWSLLEKTTLCQVITFNRRREGEVSRMTTQDYNQKYGKEHRSDIEETLTPTEKHLCRILTRVEIIGKGNRTVPVLLTPDLVDSVDLLLEMRSMVGVSEANKYLFPRIHYGSTQPIRGADCLRAFSEECGAQCPENLRSTLLRKHVATLSQVLNLKEHELDMLAKFMGHDIRIHRNYYRLPDDTLQIAKVSKIFLSLDKGTLHNQQGRGLDEINVSLDEEVEVSGNESEEETDELGNNVSSSQKDNPAVKRKRGHSSALEDTTESDASDADDCGILAKKKCTKNKSEFAPQKTGQKRIWTEDERDAVQRHLHTFILLGKLPGADAIRRCMEKEPVLKGRTWKNIKDHCRNSILTQKRKKSRTNSQFK